MMGPMSAHDPLVVIILVNWNGRDLTLDCLRSLSATTYQHHRCIVVDNASSDGSLEAIQRLFPDVIVLPLPENQRFAGGNNAGIQRALELDADLIMLLNNDTTVAPDFLSHMVDRISTDPTIGIVAPAIYYHNAPDIFWFAGGVISFWTGTMKHLGIREKDRGQYEGARTVDYASGCCILTTRKVIAAIGTLDTSYFMYAEDADWCMRVRNAGYSIMFEPKAKVWHKLSVSAGGHTSWFKMKNKFLSNFRFFGTYARWYQWLFFPWLTVFSNAFAAFRYFLQTRGKTWNSEDT
jgi:GT2 family glycosyltransferase